ncbi:BTAD domain-containing putative transcriptional regulator [Streptomyces polygonati]|uniref:BTAD domain-containing putative transcriptional regulator n=1 Tax=Streptomyces polygonati TaxID=1617087 RepID=A0ABV8HI39_9ACTN
MLSFHVLGPIEIGSPRQTLRPRGPQQRTLLVVLLANARRLVPIESLIDELWGDKPPRHVENALQAHISRLRQQLALLESADGPSRLVTHPSGYRLMVADEEVDAAVLAAGVERIRSRPQDDDPAVTVRELRRMLELWRGPVFGGPVGGRLCRAAATRYEEMRLAALELLFDSELRNGDHVRIIPELQALLTEDFYKERFRQQLMVALYRSGRQADALAVYRELWRRLTDDLGLEPSPTMRDYERAILDQDPMLDSAL